MTRITVLTLALAAGITLAASPRRNIRPVQATRPATEHHNPQDTITGDTVHSLVTVDGYRKPLAAMVESVMVTNLSATDTLSGVTVEIDYRDNAGRQLQHRTVTLRATVPPTETRHVSFPAWDRQRMFYHADTPPARRTQRTTPFHTAITPTAVYLNRSGVDCPTK